MPAGEITVEIAIQLEPRQDSIDMYRLIDLVGMDQSIFTRTNTCEEEKADKVVSVFDMFIF